MAISSNQGTVESFRQSNLLSAKLYQQVVDTRDLWRERKAILLDTHSLRHRLAPGLTALPNQDVEAGIQYYNAFLLKGYVLSGMIKLAVRDRAPQTRAILDVECGSRIEGNTLYWHERFDPKQAYVTPMDLVYVIDVGDLLWKK
jgi:hypothetical protein